MSDWLRNLRTYGELPLPFFAVVGETPLGHRRAFGYHVGDAGPLELLFYASGEPRIVIEGRLGDRVVSAAIARRGSFARRLDWEPGERSQLSRNV